MDNSGSRSVIVKKYRNTSRETWHDIKDDYGAKTFYVVDLVRKHPHKTVGELALIHHDHIGKISRNELAKRTSYLAKIGTLKESGERQCSVSKRKCITYRALDLNEAPVKKKSITAKEMKDKIDELEFILSKCTCGTVLQKSMPF